MKKLCAALLSLLGACFVAQAAPTLVSRWDFDTYNSGAVTDCLKPTAGTASASIEVRTGTGFSTPVTEGVISPAYLVDSSTAAGLPGGDYAIALPKGTHLKVPFPAGMSTNTHWTVRVRFFHPNGSGSTARALVQPDLTNRAQYLIGLNASNQLWADHTQAPASNYLTADPAENGISAGNTGSRTAGVTLWHTLTLCCGPQGFVTYLNGIRTTGSTNTNDPRTLFTGDGLLLFADNNGEDALVYVAGVELWQDTPVLHNPWYVQTSTTSLFPDAKIEDVRDSMLTCRGLGTWIAYSTPMHSFERVITGEGTDITRIRADFAAWWSGQHVLMEFVPNDSGVSGSSLQMAWGYADFSSRAFTDAGESLSPNYRAAGTAWNYGGYAPYNLFSTPFISVEGSLPWTRLVGVGRFGSPHLTVCTGEPTITFDQAPQVDNLTLESGLGAGAVHVHFAYSQDALKAMTGLQNLVVDKQVTLTVPAGVSIAGALTFQKGSVMTVSDLTVAEAATLVTAPGGVVLPEGTAIEDFVRVDTGTVTLSEDGTEILYTPFAEGTVATASWLGAGDTSNVADPANWLCYGMDGATIENALPTAETTLLVSGSTTLNIPASANFACRRVVFSGAVACLEDCDWTGLCDRPTFGNATVSIPEGKTLTLSKIDSFCTCCSFGGAGRLKATADAAFGGTFPPSVSACTDVELSGAIDFVNCNWTGSGKLVISGRSTVEADAQGSTVAAPGPLVVAEGGALSLSGVFHEPANKGSSLKAGVQLDGGTVTGTGYFTFGEYANQELDITVNAGRFEAGLRPQAVTNKVICKVVQNGGVFAPSTLLPITDETGAYAGTQSAYTLNGGVFEVPAGWDMSFPWLPITVPAEGDATIRGVQTATVAASVTVAGRLTVAATDATKTLTFVKLAGEGTLAAEGTPSLVLPAATYAQTLTSAEDASLALATEDRAVFTQALTNETYLGSLVVKGGEIDLQGIQSIGGSLTVEKGALLYLDTGTLILSADAPLFTAAKGVVLPEGVAITDCITASTGSVKLSADGTQILLVPDTTIPIIGVWTGNGDLTKSDDTANWACTNVVGEAVVSAPTRATTIFLSGETSFNIPAGTMPSCRELKITGPISLAADCDWRGLDSLTRLVDGSFIDLQGQTLKLACPDGTSPTTFTVTNSTPAAGTLCCEVPKDATFTNTSIVLGGNLRLVKDGEGTFVATRAGQTYSSGTEILAGTVLATTIGTDSPFGVTWAGENNPIIVRKGATFDLGTSYHFTAYTFQLDGGCFRASGASANSCRLGATTLLADSAWSMGADLTFWVGHALNLDEHTLTIDQNWNHMTIGMSGSTTTTVLLLGTIDVQHGGWFNVVSAVDAATVDFRMDAALNVAAQFDVHDYDAIYQGNYCKGTGLMRVFGRMTVHGGGFYGCQLQNGATLDLSQLGEVWNTTRTISNGTNVQGNGTVSFADGAVITVDLGHGRRIGPRQKVVSWTTTPTNYETLSFRAPGNASYRIFGAEDGIYATSGLAVILR